MTASVDSEARLRKGDARPARSAPKATALATSCPVLMPPLAKIGMPGLPASARAPRT